MGQQQLHLIVLGIIIVGLSIAVGLIRFNTNAIQSNRDAVILDLNNLSSDAITYYKKDDTFSGGNYSFLGFTMSDQLNDNENGIYTVISIQPQRIIFQGVGVEKEGDSGCNQSNNITYQLIVEPTESELIKIQ